MLIREDAGDSLALFPHEGPGGLELRPSPVEVGNPTCQQTGSLIAQGLDFRVTNAEASYFFLQFYEARCDLGKSLPEAIRWDFPFTKDREKLGDRPRLQARTFWQHRSDHSECLGPIAWIRGLELPHYQDHLVGREASDRNCTIDDIPTCNDRPTDSVSDKPLRLGR